jgi:transcriptional regulator with XRE-family HTH domain
MNPTSLNKIGDRIRVCRVEKKLSQENVAHEIGISITAYSKIERGQTNVSIGRLEQIATCLGVPLTRLMHAPSEDLYPAIGDIGMVREDAYLYPTDFNKQTLLMRIDNLQEELARLNKTLAEKDEIIALLKEVVAHSNSDSRKKKDKQR